MRYPRLVELGVEVRWHGAGFHFVRQDELKDKLSDRFPEFCNYFGVATCPVEGLYASDAEAVLERMKTGRLIGSQFDWD